MNTIHKITATEHLLQVHFYQIYTLAKQEDVVEYFIDEKGINEKYPGFLNTFDFSNVEVQILFQYIIYRRKWGDKDELLPIIPEYFYYIWNEDNYFWAEESDWINITKNNKSKSTDEFDTYPYLFIEYKDSPFNDLVAIDYYNLILVLNKEEQILCEWNKAFHECDCFLTFLNAEYFTIEASYFEPGRGDLTSLYKYSNGQIVRCFREVSSIELIDLAVKNGIRLDLYHLSDELKMDKQTVLRLLEKFGTAFELFDLHDSLRCDKEFILEIVKLDGKYFEYADDSIKADRQIVLEAVKSNPSSIQYCSEFLRNDSDFIMEAYRLNTNVMRFIDEETLTQNKKLLEIYNEYKSFENEQQENGNLSS